jgi:plastocyanin
MLRTRTIGLAAALFVAAGVGACTKIESALGLSHVTNDDGNDKTNPAGHNPGSTTLTMTLYATTPMRVGDTLQAAAGVSFSGMVGTKSWANLAMTDSSVASIVTNDTPLQYIAAHSVGRVQMTGHYESAVATPFNITVIPRDGISAWVDVDSAGYAWNPSAFRVAPGSSVQFNIGRVCDVVFDAGQGVPANIAVGSTGPDIVRVFPVAGTFSFHCTAYGQSGVITVTP